MLATGIKSPLGIKVSGNDLGRDRARRGGDRARGEGRARRHLGARRARQRRALHRRARSTAHAAARYGLNITDVQSVVSAAIGGENVGETIEGRSRFPINVRYPRELRDSVEKLRKLPIVTERGAQIPLRRVAQLEVSRRPADAAHRERAARRAGSTSTSAAAIWARWSPMRSAPSREQVKLPPGVSLPGRGSSNTWSARKTRLALVVPFIAAHHLRAALPDLPPLRRGAADHAVAAVRAGRRLLVPSGLLGHNLSVASAVGFIALAGVAAEFGVVMLLYLKQRRVARPAAGAERRCSRRSTRARCSACGPRR